jgi:hypothetical protein
MRPTSNSWFCRFFKTHITDLLNIEIVDNPTSPAAMTMCRRHCKCRCKTIAKMPCIYHGSVDFYFIFPSDLGKGCRNTSLVLQMAKMLSQYNNGADMECGKLYPNTCTSCRLPTVVFYAPLRMGTDRFLLYSAATAVRRPMD